jgi:electron transport complex protein RnfB
MLALLSEQPLLAALSALLGLGAIFGALLGFAAIRFRVEGNPISEQVNALLPQTQCGQCGYPGCRPYSEAIADGDAINKCPPGGEETIQALADLLDVEAQPLDAGFAKMNALAAPNVFRPARWMPFSAPPRSCIR